MAINNKITIVLNLKNRSGSSVGDVGSPDGHGNKDGNVLIIRIPCKVFLREEAAGNEAVALRDPARADILDIGNAIENKNRAVI